MDIQWALKGKKRKAVPPKQLDVKLFSPSLSVGTNSTNPRVALCCKNEAGNRVYVTSGTGLTFASNARALFSFIKSNEGITRKAALEFIASRNAEASRGASR